MFDDLVPNSKIELIYIYVSRCNAVLSYASHNIILFDLLINILLNKISLAQKWEKSNWNVTINHERVNCKIHGINLLFGGKKVVLHFCFLFFPCD